MNSSLENLQMVTSSSSPEEEEDNLCHYAMQLVSASVLPMVLKAAIELGLLEIMERAGPGALLSPFDIASQLPTANNSPEVPIVLDRILRLLASYSILTCSLNIVNSNHDIDKSDHHHHLEVHRLYGLAPVSKYFIPNKDGASLAPLFGVMQDKVMIDMWYHTKDAVLEGEVPFNRAYGMNSFEYISKDARYLPLFKASMRDYNSMFMNKILETYKGFEGLKSLVDVGGGDGTILNMILSHYPTIKAINFDLAPIIQNSPSYPAGVEHVSGDMFLSIPKGDAIFMKRKDN
ncbi:caffeic acid 3-O-methyltransferase-like isoform X2 [Cornus florida]|uniref:caffeic acid 3-O-methyltransferase-like isoform X2 n=1 Tax=Cornus florida TaxID=4283 RepID=UPI0028974795|nr:caffeic acid 3-O-methyltransferase-like isoform X2 [Cornus florida]XP_059640554.1 caffeic acid 3-O-methyltransferase-like isoform X2 [Cornus florida]